MLSDYGRTWTMLLITCSAALAGQARGESLQCPSGRDAFALTAWRQQAATALQQAGSSSSDQVALAGKINECFGPAVPACVQRLADYVGRDDVAPPGADLTAAELGQKTPPKEFLSGNGQDYVIPANIEAMAAERGWPTVRYKSRHSGGFDHDTASLLMVYVPGERVDPPVAYDRWVNLPLPADRGEDSLKPSPQAHLPSLDDYAREDARAPLPRTFTVVAIDRPSAAQPTAQIYLQKYYRSKLASPFFTAEANADPSVCVACHASGPRALSPLGYHTRQGEAQLDPAAWQAVHDINAAMSRSTGGSPPSWRQADLYPPYQALKPLLKPDAQGPGWGPVVPLNPETRSQAFILGGTAASGKWYQGCFKSRPEVDVHDIFGRVQGQANVYHLSPTPTVRWQKVAEAMRCATCHNGRYRGALTQQSSSLEIDFKILVDQSMPFGLHRDPLEQGSKDAPVVDELSGDERIALANCLAEEFKLQQSLLAQWLTAAACQ